MSWGGYWEESSSNVNELALTCTTRELELAPVTTLYTYGRGE